MIEYFHEDVSLPQINLEETSSWIEKTCVEEGKKTGEISFIFCSDDYLLKVNQDHLQHDYYTDIITFDYGNNRKISGDLFISIDRINDNAKRNKVSQQDELCRIIIHGILHLIGYGDKTPEDKTLMTSKEDYYLSLR